MVSQVFIALFGLTSLWLALDPPREDLRRFAPIVGLCGQPFWLTETYGKWGMFVLCLAYTGVYLRGAYVHWIKPRIQ